MKTAHANSIGRVFLLALLLLSGVTALGERIQPDSVSASGSQAGSPPDGAVDGDRFSIAPERSWRGDASGTSAWWEARFDSPRKIGAILQIHGSHDFVFRDSPRSYVWRVSEDGLQWRELRETETPAETRLFRLHRLREPVRARFLRMEIRTTGGAFPALREVEFYSDREEAVPFPDWIIAVNTTDQPELPGHGREFIPLARSAPGQRGLQAQQVWLATFEPAFVIAEPRPLCAFLSGNFKDWCEVAREPWRGTQEVLRDAKLPIWASCGGAQGLAILAETGVDKPWDCPHCRDPLHPKLPIYTHIGHTGTRPCGDYSACVFERGPHAIRQIGRDPAFAGLPGEFTVMESHCGQIEWPPAGWERIATAGTGSRTLTQCIRLKDRPVYAAQFHIEMDGNPEAATRIMSNFLEIAARWRNQAAGRHD